MFRHLLLLHRVSLRRKKISCSATTGRPPKAQQIRLFNGSRRTAPTGAWLASIDEVKGYPDVSQMADTLMSRPCPLAIGKAARLPEGVAVQHSTLSCFATLKMTSGASLFTRPVGSPTSNPRS